MKTKTFFYATLFLPYLSWAITKLITNTTTANFGDYSILGTISKALYSISYLYASSFWFWGIPYTFLVIGLFVWGKNKSAQKLYSAAFFSPLLLTALITIEIAIILIYIETSMFASGSQSIWNTIGAVIILTPIFSFLAAMLITPYGYVFVVVGMIIYKILARLKIIKTDGEVMPSISSMASKPFDKVFKDLAE